MNVVDAGAVVELLVGALDPGVLSAEELAAPHLLDSEVTPVLRSLTLRGSLDERQGQAALDAFGALVIRRFPADWLQPRRWELRHNLSGYDATYVALAETINASALLTTDARLTNAPGSRCRIRLL